jgi:hypothetical protein
MLAREAPAQDGSAGHCHQVFDVVWFTRASTTNEHDYEITVRLDDGATRAIHKRPSPDGAQVIM